MQKCGFAIYKKQCDQEKEPGCNVRFFAVNSGCVYQLRVRKPGNCFSFAAAVCLVGCLAMYMRTYVSYSKNLFK